MSLDQTEEILAENLEDQADVNAIRGFMSEVIEKGEGMGLS
jgi:hypothetical protein